MASASGLTRLDPFSDEFQQCPFPALAAVRRTSAVLPLVEPGWYIVTTMDLVREVLTDPGRFSNQVSRRTPPPPEVAEKAGNESSTRLLADIVWQLDARPDEWAHVRAEAQRADRIIEEAVRLASPSASVFRRVVHDTTLGGYRLPAEATLVVSVLSANRDETTFPNPDQFDPDRPTTQRHVAFGLGIHACIGNVLARMEARHAVAALARHVARIDVVQDRPLRYLPSLIVRGLAELPVHVRRREPAA